MPNCEPITNRGQKYFTNYTYNNTAKYKGISYRYWGAKILMNYVEYFKNHGRLTTWK